MAATRKDRGNSWAGHARLHDARAIGLGRDSQDNRGNLFMPSLQLRSQVIVVSFAH